MKRAYDQGVSDALSSFGVRTASLSRSPMPMGDMNLGAERFTKAIGSDPEVHQYDPSANKKRQSKNNVFGMGETTPGWSSPSSVESGGAVGSFNSGVTPYGGV
jgi:hypothetical protein